MCPQLGNCGLIANCGIAERYGFQVLNIRKSVTQKYPQICNKSSIDEIMIGCKSSLCDDCDYFFCKKFSRNKFS